MQEADNISNICGDIFLFLIHDGITQYKHLQYRTLILKMN